MSDRSQTFKRSAANFWKVFRRSRMGNIGAFLLITMLLVATFAPLLTPYTPTETVRTPNGKPLIYAPPSVHPPLGTDDAGHDVWAQLVYGARISLMVGFFAGFLSMFIGSTLGTLAGFYGGRTDTLLMRTTDVFLVIPDLPLTIILIAVIRQLNIGIPVIAVLIVVIGILYWTTTARLIRSQVLSIKERQFVSRARDRGGQLPHHAQAYPAASAAADRRQYGVDYFHCDFSRIRFGLSRSRRSHPSFVGHDVAFCF